MRVYIEVGDTTIMTQTTLTKAEMKRTLMTLLTRAQKHIEELTRKIDDDMKREHGSGTAIMRVAGMTGAHVRSTELNAWVRERDALKYIGGF